MKELLTKRFTEIGAADIRRLVDAAAEESVSLELKGPLPSPEGRDDPWQAGDNRILPFARDQVLSEVVGMANAAGGLVVLGVNETGDDPPRASTPFPLRDCIDLASRFDDAAWSCIDPRLPSLEVKGIPLADGGAGAVIFRVQSSHQSPHGSTTTRRAYVRRGTSTETLFIREVQEMTLRSVSVVEKLEQRLESRRPKLRTIVAASARGSIERLGIRISIIPTSPSVVIHRIYDKLDLFPDLHQFIGIVSGNKVKLSPPISVQDINRSRVLPTLRGGLRTCTKNEKFFLSQAVYQDGLVELLFHFASEGGDSPVFSSWLLGLLCNALRIADTARRIAGAPGTELVLDLEIESGVSNPLYVGFEELRQVVFDDIEQGVLEPNPLRLQYPVRGLGGFSDLVKWVLNDLREAAGLRAVDDFEVDFG